MSAIDELNNRLIKLELDRSIKRLSEQAPKQKRVEPEHTHKFTVAVEWGNGFIGERPDGTTFFEPDKRDAHLTYVTKLRCESCTEEITR